MHLPINALSAMPCTVLVPANGCFIGKTVQPGVSRINLYSRNAATCQKSAPMTKAKMGQGGATLGDAVQADMAKPCS
jgi:hypothetical protein